MCYISNSSSPYKVNPSNFYMENGFKYEWKFSVVVAFKVEKMPNEARR